MPAEFQILRRQGKSMHAWVRLRPERQRRVRVADSLAEEEQFFRARAKTGDFDDDPAGYFFSQMRKLSARLRNRSCGALSSQDCHVHGGSAVCAAPTRHLGLLD